MKLTRNFSLSELIKSDTTIRLGIDNNPNADQMDKLKLELEAAKTKINKDLQEDRLDSEDKREGVRIAAKLATDASKDMKEEARLVLDAAKQLQDEK